MEINKLAQRYKQYELLARAEDLKLQDFKSRMFSIQTGIDDISDKIRLRREKYYAAEQSIDRMLDVCIYTALQIKRDSQKYLQQLSEEQIELEVGLKLQQGLLDEMKGSSKAVLHLKNMLEDKKQACRRDLHKLLDARELNLTKLC